MHDLEPPHHDHHQGPLLRNQLITSLPAFACFQTTCFCLVLFFFFPEQNESESQHEGGAATFVFIIAGRMKECIF